MSNGETNNGSQWVSAAKQKREREKKKVVNAGKTSKLNAEYASPS